MKKTISLLLAIVVAAVSICTLTICAFADPADGETTTTTTTAAQDTTKETTTALDLGDPRETTTEEKKETTTEEKKETTKDNGTTATTKTGTDVVTNPSGVTSIDDGDATTKKPAAVDDDIPNTGSGIVVPAIALLALAGGVTVAVKSKKD